MKEYHPSIHYELIRPVAIGLLLSLSAVFLGEAAGLAFNRYKTKIIETYKIEVTSHKRDVFLQEREVKKAISQTWIFTKRFHYHAMGLGAISISLILALAITWVSASVKRLLSIALGAGALLIPSGWFLTALKTSYMGATAAQKSLEALILCCTGMHVAAVLAVILVYILWFIYGDNIPEFLAFLKR